MRKGVICKKTTIMFVMLLRHACIMTSMFTVGLIIQCFREWWSGTRRIRHEVCRALRYIVPFFFSVGVTTNGSKEIHDYVCTQKIRPRRSARHEKTSNGHLSFYICALLNCIHSSAFWKLAPPKKAMGRLLRTWFIASLIVMWRCFIK